jgi:hypothetical protein
VRGHNQYRRVSLDTFFAAQRERVEQAFDEHVARVRTRLRAYEDDLLDMETATGVADVSR